MLDVICAEDTFHQHVINICFHGVPDQILKDFVNYALEVALAFLSPKGITL